MYKLNHDSKMEKFDVQKIRDLFPILSEKVHGKNLIYFDNAASTQKPISVIERVAEFYKKENSNVHRGVHKLSQLATHEFESARKKIQKFINAKKSSEIIFTRGTTEAINLVAHSFAKNFLNEGDEVIISHLEHHSNIVPWQIVCEEKNAKLRIIPIDTNGEILFEEFEKLINEKTKFISVIHVSNSLGTVNPIERIIAKAHEHNIPVMIDGAQSIQHTFIDVQKLDADFFAFSGHKIYAPTGIGVLYGKENWLEKLPPYQGGGDMILSVSFEKTTYNELPYKFEAGTPNISGAIGLGAAIDFISSIGIHEIEKYENELINYALEKISSLTKVRIIGEPEKRAGVIAFILAGIHPHDIGTILDREGVAIRTGHHCTQPIMKFFNLPATARASFGIYNTKDEVDIFCDAILKVFKVFE